MDRLDYHHKRCKEMKRTILWSVIITAALYVAYQARHEQIISRTAAKQATDKAESGPIERISEENAAFLQKVAEERNDRRECLPHENRTHL